MDIKLQEAAVTAQPGDASSLTVRSWALDGDRRLPRGETGEMTNPILQRGPPNLVVMARRGGVCEEHFQLCGEHCPSFVHPQV